MSKKITPALEREALKLAAEGHSSRAIAAEFEKTHGIKVSHQAVGNILRQTRTERGEVAKVVTREALAKSVTSDLEHLEEVRAELQRARRMAFEAVCALGDPDDEDPNEEAAAREARKARVAKGLAWSKLYPKLAELEMKATEKKLDLSGANEKDTGESNAPGIHVLFPPLAED